jgi:hypothetical protein
MIGASASRVFESEKIDGKCVLGADGLAEAVGADLTVVDAAPRAGILDLCGLP